MTNCWIITTNAQIGSMVEAARSVGGTVTVLAVGEVEGFAGVDAVVRVPLAEGLPAEAAGPAVADAIAASGAEIVLAPNRGAERVLAGAVAARLVAPVLTGVTGYADGTFDVSRYGITVEHTRTVGPVVVIMDGGTEVQGEPVAATEADARGVHDARVTEESSTQARAVNLAAAQRIVAVGRGFRTEEDLQLARDLADAIGAELGCTRPLAEGSDWMPKNTYIGVSGAVVAPELYIAVGVSGQLHHTAGVNGAGTVVVINDDPSAPYFAESDHGIVGDLYEVLPALTAALR
nr:electron transfer flavoprotein subunit alpha/FixB family protein [Actinomycetales bacterium]